MPFRETFDCLWCGRSHQTRSTNDAEGWAQLCPDCLGRAQENGFLKARLRAALRERSLAFAQTETAALPASRAAPASPAVPSAVPLTSVLPLATDIPPPTPASTLPSPSHDDWYLRRGSFSNGPLIDMPWQMELDEVTRWLDEIPLGGVIVELAAGSGWWSTLLAEKGELWIYDADEAALETARTRLVAHGLRAHLHQRGPFAPAERAVDAVFGAYLMGRATEPARLDAQLDVVRSWLKPTGTFAFVEARTSEAEADVAPGPGAYIRPRTVDALTSALEREISDRVQVTTSRGGLSVLGWVERIDHQIGKRGLTVTDLAVRKLV